MIFETLAHMADRADDDKDNYSSDFNQAKRVLDDVKNTGTKTVIDFATKGGDTQFQAEKLNEYKHYIVGMQQKQPQSVIQRNVDSSSSSSGAYVPALLCSGGTEPSLILTITGASGTIDWCGKTWNLPDDSGLRQEVCPTTYFNDQASAASYLLGKATFVVNGTGGNGLIKLRRAYGQFSSFGTYRLNELSIRDINGGLNPKVDLNYYLHTLGTSTLASTSNPLGLINSVPSLPTVSDYQITDDFFGSHTFNGITYTWEKGTNW